MENFSKIKNWHVILFFMEDQYIDYEVQTKPITFRDLVENKKLLDKNATHKSLSYRSELIKKFVDRLNEDRKLGGYKPLNPGFVASKMYNAGMRTDFLLNWFYGYCNDARHFSKCWWWSLNPKNANTPL